MTNLGPRRFFFALVLSAFTTTLCMTAGCGNDPPAVGQNGGTGGSGGADAPVIILPPGMDGPVGTGGTGGPFGGFDGPYPFGYDGGYPDVPSAICGDGVLQTGETCDDGNAIPGDGCSGICTVEPGYACPTTGTLCKPLVSQTCGNKLIEGSESCDDGNTVAGDGCSFACAVEVGWKCTVPGQPCTPSVTPSVCGNGTVESGEQCDDGNTLPTDGCTATCMLEAHWSCPTPGKPCVAVAYCGDGVLQTERGEACDDNNAAPGDGCSGICTIEAGYACPTPGHACVKVWVCGNGIVDPGEVCDDGNTAASDGCVADCTAVEAGWTCPKGANNTGGPCSKVPANVCGNSAINAGENCDDGNTLPNDGCSATCTVEAGWNCPTPGAPCKLISYCGNSVVDLDIGESCDDGNTTGGDGCTTQCALEPNFVCPTPGKPCISTVKCGDGKITGTETCDDGNTLGGDGCSTACALEAGWICPIVAVPCSAKACGDGVLAGVEQCDDGNTVATDGCSATCQLEAGWACGPDVLHPTALATACYRTTCGDGHREGTEQCDDGNKRPFDGCAQDCTNEPKCGYLNDNTSQPYQCFSMCGDGLKMPDEECDDGNVLDDDGCSSKCKVEAGYTCVGSAAALGTTLTIPVLYRDFTWHHPQFEVDPVYDQRQVGIASSVIGVNGKPVYNTAYVGNNAGTSLNRAFTMDGPAMNTTGTLMTDASGATFRTKASSNTASLSTADVASYYAQWYTDAEGATGDPAVDAANPNINRVTVQGTLSLTSNGAGAYQYYSTSFFPLDGLGYGNISYSSTEAAHNFCFTSEAHYWFQYQGGERFEFRGDDDVWVFINGQLAVDLGGIHSELRGIVTLNGASTQVCVDEKPSTAATPATCNNVTSGFGMVAGNIYEIIIFQAERHVTKSNYQLTLSGFNAPKSVCTPNCGDGVVTRGEACDLGTSKNTGDYGTCNGNCTLPPRCGDAIVQTTYEQCDDGVNLATYGGTVKRCGANCKWAPYCGDGVVSNGEQCDEGSTNGSGYGHCNATCTLGARCGDGIVNGAEACDDGANNGTTGSNCTVACALKCGNGIVEAGEQCDDGTAKNTGGYGKCTSTCTFGPYCGDGIKTGTEQCDDGKNDGTYGTCSPGCVPPPYCGDGLTNGPELCDLGALNAATAYGLDKCTDQCLPAPYCGDKQVEGQFGEVCDDGVNSGLPGSCTVDCTGFVPLPSCGDGSVVAPEQCDDGAFNGTTASKCDTHCRIKCGNGIKDLGEQCDNGVNNGAYGTCNSDCTLAGYCGDGLTNGTEQCDFGAANNVAAATAYGRGICTTYCMWAPFCGDGRVQTTFGEQCDGNSNCGGTCQLISGPIPIY
jgi:fibro-slime domain-containing protein